MGLVHEIGTTCPTTAEIRIAHPTVMTDSPTESAYWAKISTSAFGGPTVEKHFEGDHGFGVMFVCTVQP